jgi:hypothetical protein
MLFQSSQGVDVLADRQEDLTRRSQKSVRWGGEEAQEGRWVCSEREEGQNSI